SSNLPAPTIILACGDRRAALLGGVHPQPRPRVVALIIPAHPNVKLAVKLALADTYAVLFRARRRRRIGNHMLGACR
ncbi:MAG: hypothetical protein Q8K85_19885, partial [Hyphomicrobium sp.]|nr:hypothetical protein [Hyphomicrobium sp.]